MILGMLSFTPSQISNVKGIDSLGLSETSFTRPVVSMEDYVKMLPTGNHYPSRRRSDTMDYFLLCVGIVIWVKYLC